MEKCILACGWIDFTWSMDVLVILFLITRGPFSSEDKVKKCRSIKILILYTKKKVKREKIRR